VQLNLKGESINLRSHKKSDAGNLAVELNDFEVIRYTTIPHPYHLEDGLAYIKLAARNRNRKIITQYDFALAEKASDRLIGGLGLMRVDHLHKKAELGYWLSRAYWGKGVMQEAIRLALDFSFNQLGLVRVYAEVLQLNLASRRCLERAGFQFEGVSQKAMFNRGEWFDLYNYARVV